MTLARSLELCLCGGSFAVGDQSDESQMHSDRCGSELTRKLGEVMQQAETQCRSRGVGDAAMQGSQLSTSIECIVLYHKCRNSADVTQLITTKEVWPSTGMLLK